MNYYCKYCGTKASSIASLAASTCPHHPNGANQGMHALHDRGVKAVYECKFCGVKAVSSSSLTAHICRRHPQGENAGHHEPVLLTTPPGKNEQLKEQLKERIRERIEKRLQEAKIEKQIPDLDTHQNSHQILNIIVALAEENNMIRAADRIYASNQADPETAETWDETIAGLVSMAELFPKELEIFQAFYQLVEENADTMDIVANIELMLSEE